MKQIVLPTDAEIGHIITEKLSVDESVMITPALDMRVIFSYNPMIPKDILKENDIVIALVEKDTLYLSGSLFNEISECKYVISLAPIGRSLIISKSEIMVVWNG